MIKLDKIEKFCILKQITDYLNILKITIMDKDFKRAQISEVEIFGVETKQNPMPQWLRLYEDRPLWLYRLFLKYRGSYRRDPRCKVRPLDGRCMLTLSTHVKKDDELVLVQGHISVDSYSQSKASGINFVPKQKIFCSSLEGLIADYIGHSGLYDWFFDREMIDVIKNPLFTCNRKEIPLIRGYNRDGLLDKVSVDMSLFEPVNS